MRVGWAAYIIPFVFVGSPALLLDGSWSAIATASILSVIGVGAICLGVVGFFSSRLGVTTRVAFVASGLGALPAGYLPAAWDPLHIVCAAAALGLAAILFFFKRQTTANNQLTETTSAREESQ